MLMKTCHSIIPDIITNIQQTAKFLDHQKQMERISTAQAVTYYMIILLLDARVQWQKSLREAPSLFSKIQ